MESKKVLDITSVMIMPRVDASNAKTVETELTALVNSGTRKLVCNFTKNEYISSAGLRVFLSTLKMLKKAEGQMVLCGLQPYVQEVFEMAGFSQLFKMYNTEEEAIQECK